MRGEVSQCANEQGCGQRCVSRCRKIAVEPAERKGTVKSQQGRSNTMLWEYEEGGGVCSTVESRMGFSRVELAEDMRN